MRLLAETTPETYANRKWSVSIKSRYYSGTHRFENFSAAVSYVYDQMMNETAESSRLSSFTAEIGGPGGFIPQDYIWRFVSAYSAQR